MRKMKRGTESVKYFCGQSAKDFNLGERQKDAVCAMIRDFAVSTLAITLCEERQKQIAVFLAAYFATDKSEISTI